MHAAWRAARHRCNIAPLLGPSLPASLSMGGGSRCKSAPRKLSSGATLLVTIALLDRPRSRAARSHPEQLAVPVVCRVRDVACGGVRVGADATRRDGLAVHSDGLQQCAEQRPMVAGLEEQAVARLAVGRSEPKAAHAVAHAAGVGADERGPRREKLLPHQARWLE
eukprot:scaffold12352_cov129-Isochrysis_galbana.AAC.5